MKSFIQAGGRSSRMGADKAWLPLDGRPLIEHVLDAARKVSTETHLVISHKNSQAENYQRLAEHLNARICIDLSENCGPLGGIYTALTRCLSDESALILACDAPFVTAEFLQRLRQIHEQANAQITVPLDAANRVQMLTGFYSAACRESLARMLSWRELQTDRLCLRQQTRFVVYDEYADLPGAARFHLNLNTPQDYQPFK